MKSLLFLASLLFLTFHVNGQVGIGTTLPDAALDVFSANDGFLVPRIRLLIGANSSLPLAAPTNSEIIYNTATIAGVNAVTPGFYFWNATRWERFVTGATTGWLTTGNTGIIDGTNFIGTAAATNVDVAFRRNNLASGKIAATSTSFGLNSLTLGATSNGTAFGLNALAANTGSNNTAFGTGALAANTTSANNTAVGFNTLAINTPNADTGAQNTAVGSGALASLNGGNNNTAVGFNALTACSGLSLFNTAVGSNALKNISAQASRDNVAVGYNALGSTGVTITNSVAVGSNALLNANDNTTRNTAIGNAAGSNITSGNDNVVIGANAQVVATTGNQIAIGSAANATGTYQIVIGGGAAVSGAFINAPSWSTSSDRRLKSDIKDSPLGLDFLKTLHPVSYFRNDDVNKKTEYGFIAQELEIALNNAGSTNSGILGKTSNGMFAVRYNDFLPITVKAVQEQQVQIEELKKANAELLKMNTAILKRLEALEKK